MKVLIEDEEPRRLRAIAEGSKLGLCEYLAARTVGRRPQSLLDHIGTPTPTKAVCWKLKPDPASPLYASGLEVRVTSHDRALVLPGHGSGSFLPGV